jgi:hypothetical protein
VLVLSQLLRVHIVTFTLLPTPMSPPSLEPTKIIFYTLFWRPLPLAPGGSCPLTPLAPPLNFTNLDKSFKYSRSDESFRGRSEAQMETGRKDREMERSKVLIELVRGFTAADSIYTNHFDSYTGITGLRGDLQVFCPTFLMLQPGLAN